MDGIVLTISCENYYVCKWLCDNNLRKLRLYVAYLATDEVLNVITVLNVTTVLNVIKS